MSKETSKRNIRRRKAPSQERAKEKVEQILTAAKKLLVESGLDKLTTNHIAKESNMSVGSLYQYYPNKQSILYELYSKMLRETRDSLILASSQVNSFDEFSEAINDDVYAFWKKKSEEQTYQRELSKAMRLYPELQKMDVLHGQEIASIIKGMLIRFGASGSEEELHELGLFFYEHYNLLENLIVDLDCDPKRIIAWHKRAISGVLSEYID